MPPSAGALLLAAVLLLPGAALAGDWITFVDETSTRIVADPEVGIDDVQEKDITSGDVDKDGDTDIVIVRKIPFTNAGGFRNVLFMNVNGVMTDRTATLAPDFLDATDDRDVELADVDGDTWLDIITSGTFDEQPRILMNRGAAGRYLARLRVRAAAPPGSHFPHGQRPEVLRPRGRRRHGQRPPRPLLHRLRERPRRQAPDQRRQGLLQRRDGAAPDLR